MTVYYIKMVIEKTTILVTCTLVIASKSLKVSSKLYTRKSIWVCLVKLRRLKNAETHT